MNGQVKVTPSVFCQEYIKHFAGAQCKLLSERKNYKQMGIELGGIGGALSSVGSAAGGLASSVGRGLEGGGISGPSTLAGFGSKLEIAATSLINEGPVRSGALEHSMTYQPSTFDLTGDLRFNPQRGFEFGGLEESFGPDAGQAAVAEAERWLNIQPQMVVEPLSEQAVLKEAEVILKSPQVEIPAIKPELLVASRPQANAIPFPSPDLIQVERTKTALEKAGLLELSTKVALGVQTSTEIRASSRQVLSAATPQVQEQQVAQAIEQEVEVEERIRQELNTKEEEEIERVKFLHIVDKEAVIKRITKILARVPQVILNIKIKEDPEDTAKPIRIKGFHLTAGLPSSNQQEIRGGELNRKDPEGRLADKTWDATLEQLGKLDFDSVEQIEAQVPEVVLDNHPVDIATVGEVASAENVAKSHQNGKTSYVHLECEKRRKLKRQQIIKVFKESGQPIQIIEEEKEDIPGEESIQNHPELAEALLAKAA